MSIRIHSQKTTCTYRLLHSIITRKWFTFELIEAKRLFLIQCPIWTEINGFNNLQPSVNKMMIKKFAAVASLAVLAVATPTPTGGQCNTGPVQCCQSVQDSGSGGLVSTLLGLLGVVLDGVNVPIGLTCSPISVIGLGGNSCTAQPVCCDNNSFNGLIAIGCTPINIGL
ncbi:hydrophobin [Pyrrhoderma noxium]|uniref:Hydrophobin n=1 Tax=Pyrrhoderma noxium TaxID=2282107 RepID=A0A286USM0_9AGAM|nr:hydrophobin [Pyrrhoderma noxium]